jgi:hypothetical protein
MKHFELPIGEKTLDFSGRLLYTVNNDRGDRPRWAELRLYKVLSEAEDDEPRLIWLLYTIGHTLVYHTPRSRCRKGKLTAVRHFEEVAEDPDNLEPCGVCDPPDWEDAGDGTLFDLEVTWYSYTPCPTPGKVYDALCRPGTSQLSAPGRELLEGAQQADPELTGFGKVTF